MLVNHTQFIFFHIFLFYLLNNACLFLCADVKEDAWKPNGCQAIRTTAATITCGCTHLTDFSVLIDPEGQQQEPAKKKSKTVVIIAAAAGGGALLLVVLVIVTVIVFKTRCRGGSGKHSKSFGKSDRIDTAL